MVVGRLEHDHVVTCLAQGSHVVRSVVDVDVGFDLGLGPQEADVPIGDPSVVEPGDGVAHRLGMAPVGVEPMGDDADPHAGIGQPPKGIGAALDGGQCAEQAVFGDCHAMQPDVFGFVEMPLVEPPGTLLWQCVRVDTALLRHERPEAERVVGTNPIEVDTEDERVVHVAQP